ncbi:MAG: ABC transporter ATP-binding protein [Chloroflexi bacterium]|nr:ABC transporter ATP-binding protein [Chloroflexota bacterium]
MSNIVQVNDLSKTYGDQTAVNRISFAIREGEIFGLLGPNGAGKTTTISILSTLLAPNAGEIKIAGYDVRRETARVKEIVGIVPQELALYPTLSARDNLEFFGQIYGLRGRALKARIEEALEIVGLRARGDDVIETFSGGMKRRINLAAGLLHKPKILFLDEPTVGVDPQSRNFIFENVQRLNQDGMTILYTTHYMEEAERLCHRVAIIDQGKIVALDTPHALIAMLGGGVIHIGLRESPNNVIEQVRTFGAVKTAQWADGKLAVQTHNVNAALVGVINAFNAANVPINSLEILEPNLESVFLHLTGKHLRD